MGGGEAHVPFFVSGLVALAFFPGPPLSKTALDRAPNSISFGDVFSGKLLLKIHAEIRCSRSESGWFINGPPGGNRRGQRSIGLRSAFFSVWMYVVFARSMRDRLLR